MLDSRSARSKPSGNMPLFRKHSILSNEEMYLLMEQYCATGDVTARNRVIAENFRLVWLEVRKILKSPHHPLFGEAYNEAIVAMCHAATKYDSSKGAKFTSYAMLWVQQQVKRFLFDNGPAAHITTAQARELRQEWIEELERTSPDDPMLKKLKERQTSESGKKIRYDVACRVRSTELDDEMVDKTSGSAETHSNPVLGYLESTAEIVDSNECVTLLAEVLSEIPERYRKVIGMRYGLPGYAEDPMTCQQIGDSGELGAKISRERVRQLEALSMDKLKAAIRERNLKVNDFL